MTISANLTNLSKSHELRFALRKRYLLSTCGSLHLSPCLQAVLAFRVSFFRRAPALQQSFSIIPCHDPIFRRLCLPFRIRISRARSIRGSLARAFALEPDGLSREGLTADRCIKRFIFTRTAGSRASWHNASGNNHAFRGPARYSDRRKPPLYRSAQHTDDYRTRTVYHR